MPGTVTLVLIYEPSSGSGSFPVARIDDKDLAMAVARKAIQIAKRRARRLSVVDPDIGKQEQVEAKRLSDLLAILLPSA